MLNLSKTNSDEIFGVFEEFYNAAKQYARENNIEIDFVIDQTNVYKRWKIENKLNNSFIEFMIKLFVNCQFCDKLILSSSNSNEDLDSILRVPSESTYAINIFQPHKRYLFDKDNVRLFLEKKFNLQYNDDELNELETITGNVPLEILYFGNTKNVNNFQERLKNYISNRAKLIGRELSMYYEIKSKEPKWEAKFLEFFVILDTESEIPDLNFQTTIDRKYMFVENDQLYSVSPIAYEVLNNFYGKIMKKYEQTNNVALTEPLKILYKDIDKKNDPALKGRLFEKIIIADLLKREKSQFTLKCHSMNPNVSSPISLSMKFSKTEFIKDNFGVNHNFAENILFIPFKFNNRFTDLFFYGEGILYAIQITINIFTHKNSDTQFYESAEFKKITENPEVKKVNFVWVTINEDVKKLENHFKNSLKDQNSWVILAKENTEIWSFLNF